MPIYIKKNYSSLNLVRRSFFFRIVDFPTITLFIYALSRNRLYTLLHPSCCKCSRNLVVPFGQGAVHAVRFHIEAHCFTLESITRLGSRPMLSPARFAFTFAFACVFRSASRTLRVYTNELGDPRSEPGNWNVRIKLAARPSIAAPLTLPFIDQLHFFLLSLSLFLPRAFCHRYPFRL